MGEQTFGYVQQRVLHSMLLRLCHDVCLGEVLITTGLFISEKLS